MNHASKSRTIERAAADWLAKQDRGLTPAEEVEFRAWHAVAEHARVLHELEGPFRALDRVASLRPTHGEPKPDLFAPVAKEPRRYGTLWISLAAAAALALGAFWFARAPVPPAASTPGSLIVHDTPQRLTLPDGSVVEFKFGTQVEPLFTANERRVRLTQGEAQFSVAKDPARPFIVRVEDVEVRAIGTVFTVSASSANVEVVVTEGRVRVDDAAGRNLVAPPTSPIASQSPALNAGQFVVIPTPAAPGPAPAQIAPPQLLQRAALLQNPWLEFIDMPLAEVIAEFNRHGARHSNVILRVADAATGSVRVSGTFRADQAEAFVRLLQSTFGLSATSGADGSLTLRKN